MSDTGSLEDPCPHPTRSGRHEIYIDREDKRVLVCHACGATGQNTYGPPCEDPPTGKFPRVVVNGSSYKGPDCTCGKIPHESQCPAAR